MLSTQGFPPLNASWPAPTAHPRQHGQAQPACEPSAKSFPDPGWAEARRSHVRGPRPRRPTTLGGTSGAVGAGATGTTLQDAKLPRSCPPSCMRRHSRPHYACMWCCIFAKVSASPVPPDFGRDASPSPMTLYPPEMYHRLLTPCCPSVLVHLSPCRDQCTRLDVTVSAGQEWEGGAQRERCAIRGRV